MFKTGQLTKTVYNTNPNHSQPIHLFTPSTTSSSGSICDTDPSSISSSIRSNHEDFNGIPTDESLIAFIDKLKRELTIVKQAKSQLAALYKVNIRLRIKRMIVFRLSQVKCKSDLDKSAKITKLRLQFEYELNCFCKQDQKDLVCYLQRQLLIRDQRITELSYDLEQLRNASIQQQQQQGESGKLEPIQILRFDDPDLVISTVSAFILSPLPA